MRITHYILVLCSLFTLHVSLAQVNQVTEPTGQVPAPKLNSGTISGKVIDLSNGEILTGVTVLIEGTTKAVRTDLDGKFLLPNLSPGSYQISFRLFSYQSKTIPVEVKVGEVQYVDASLEKENKGLKEFVITTEMKKESMNTLLIQQKNAPSVSDAISIETIRKSPDRNTSDVLKRISGTSIQDNKFAIIRGLSDRYNTAFINGAPLPSTESDRKAFSFDLFPSNLIDNLTITKTATPDQPGDFAGGIIAVNTRDIPEKTFYSLQYGNSFNSLATFKPYVNYPGGKWDWLGIDDGTRQIPSGIPSSSDYTKYSKTQQTQASKLFANTWGLNRHTSALPGFSFQYTMGHRKVIKGKEFGSMFGLSYNNTQRYNQVTRQDYDGDGQIFSYKDDRYAFNTLAGAIWNLSLKLNSNNKISLKNTVNVTSENTTIERKGYNKPNDNNNYMTGLFYQQNVLSSHQLIGDHLLGTSGFRIKWNTSLSLIRRQIPDYRRMQYMQPADDPSLPYQAFISTTASPEFGGRFYSKLNENMYSANASVSKNVEWKSSKTEIKAGGYVCIRDRQFQARNMGYVINNLASSGLLYLPQNQIFDSSHINNKGFRLSENTNPSDFYTAQSYLYAGYIQFDTKLGEKLRFVYGGRTESYRQVLNSHGYTNEPITIDTTVVDFLPSMNATWMISKKANFRLAASKTVSRPEFRELAPFAFFDFDQFITLQGNNRLVRTKITNIDVRYEIFPGAGEVISVSGFFKHFNNPIELILDPAMGGGTRNMFYQNINKASNVGLEFEFRKKLTYLDKIFKTKFMKDLSVSFNYAWIRSSIDVSKVAGTEANTRPLQGQSPYLVNGGLFYSNEKGWNASVMVNRVGRRITTVGTSNYPSYWENPRTIIDAQIARNWKKWEFRLNGNDLLAQNLTIYQDMNKNGKFDAADNAIRSVKFGRNISFTVGYRF